MYTFTHAAVNTHTLHSVHTCTCIIIIMVDDKNCKAMKTLVCTFPFSIVLMASLTVDIDTRRKRRHDINNTERLIVTDMQQNWLLINRLAPP